MSQNFFSITGTAPCTWKTLRAAAEQTLADLKAELLKAGLEPDEWALAEKFVLEEETLRDASAAALDLTQSALQIRAAAGRVEWRADDSPSLRPRPQVRVDGGPWINLKTTD